MLKNIGINILLILCSLLVGIVMVEAALRLFFPKYQYAAESQFDRDSHRIWSRHPNVSSERTHPDTGKNHPIIYNNLAMRQHRNFSKEDLEGAVNIGFFGDSFTENLRLMAPYSFTEPLDYLLNSSGKKFNVLNFGVDGYGTDQAYLYYKYSEYARRLAYVFYVLSANDLRNIYENNLFSISKEGLLIKNSAPESPWWINFLAKFYTSYLVLDLWQKWSVLYSVNRGPQTLEELYVASSVRKDKKERYHSARADAIETDFLDGRESNDLENSIHIFLEILSLWRQSVEENGAKFYIVLLPRKGEDIFTNVIGPDYKIVNLYRLLTESIKNYNEQDWYFKNDGHWNETGNLLAAKHLYRVLEREAKLAPLPDPELEHRLYIYYSAFARSGWIPTIGVSETAASPGELDRIRSKYMAFDLNKTVAN